MERNFETVMIEQCAPVLAGLKPAGLFRYETRDCADLAARVRCWNDQLGEKGLKVRVLKGLSLIHISWVKALHFTMKQSEQNEKITKNNMDFLVAFT